MSAVRDLTRLRDSLSGVSTLARIVPALDHAIALAREAEYEAARAANLAQCGIEPAYPPLVRMLAAAAPEEGWS